MMTAPVVPKTAKLDADNFMSSALWFRDRQAGVSLVFDPFSQTFAYNAYCLETKVVTELFSAEFDYLDDALACVNDEFGTWELREIAPSKSGCSSCAAKK